MAPMPPLPEPLWKTASPEVQAAVLALVDYYEQRLAQLESRVKDLDNRLKLNSTNSSKPPSSDPIGLKRKPPAPPQQEEAWRPTRTSQGPPRLGPAREGPRHDQLHPEFLSPPWSRAFRRGSRTADPPSR